MPTAATTTTAGTAAASSMWSRAHDTQDAHGTLGMRR